MKILVVGGGGREHTLVWKLAQCPSVDRILWSPGNPAAATDPKVEIHSLRVDDIPGLVSLAEKNRVNLTIVGPEKPLVSGISDEFQKRKLAIFGPTRQAAQLEGSKVFAKQFFLKHRIPTGRAEIFTELSPALKYAKAQPKPVVVKADGLAAGKGVIICKNDAEAEAALREIMEQKVFGDSGRQVLIEECLTGVEVSVHAMTDGKSYQILASAQDHKRIFDNDQGPNTGGMGAYSPTPFFTPEIEKIARKEIIERTIAGLQADGIPYCGILYAGLMLTADGPKILEYNCRFGDPETQVILPRLKNDLAEVCLAACRGKLDTVKMKWARESAICVVIAAGGYPGTPHQGDVIHGLEEAGREEKVCVLHAGTALKEKDVVTAGGRVLGVTALGKNLRESVDRAYRAIDKIRFEGMQFRRDIAAKAFKQG
jgi:phosphoribosylamine--glycine ligase